MVRAEPVERQPAAGTDAARTGAAGTPTPEGTRPDGRHLRRQQNRTAVIDALIGLFAEGAYTPSAAEIAGRAGLSLRSLFRYFDDVDDLVRAAIDRHQTRYRSLVDPGTSPEEPAERKVQAVAEARVRLFESLAPSARAARVWAHRHPSVRDEMLENRAGLRRQIRLLFARELDGRENLLAALDALCSFETYDLLRSDQGLSKPATVDAVTAAMLALVGGA